jgi:uncharacterized repeat protein (TIGR03803 family)
LSHSTKAVYLLVIALIARVSVPASAGTISTLANFSTANGANPYGGLITDAGGNLYGTTYRGGTNSVGTIFKLTPTGTLSTLASFNSVNGSYPHAELIADAGGNMYGTTEQGGANARGTVFKLTPAGTLTTFATFNSVNGSYPQAGLITDSGGNLYGTTREGGARGRGSIFKLTPGGTLSTLASFDNINIADGGSHPVAGLTFDSGGNLYGTTRDGGVNDYGSVFKLTPGGSLSTLVSFSSAKGSFPQGGLIADSGGNLYGTTRQGGTADYGTIFKLTPSGTLSTLASFSSISSGRYPNAALTVDVSGNLFGTTSYGGTNDYGTLFKLSPAGTLTTLASLTGASGANPSANPYAGLTVDSGGNFYSTAYGGGTSTVGTVFKLASAGFISLIGDSNADNHVDFTDLVALAQHYGQLGNATWAEGDFTRDGAVNFADLVALAQHYGQSAPSGFSTSAGASADFASDWAVAQSVVPEPATFAAVAAGWLALVHRRRF